jgi:hypothetical protein
MTDIVSSLSPIVPIFPAVTPILALTALMALSMEGLAADDKHPVKLFLQESKLTLAEFNASRISLSVDATLFNFFGFTENSIILPHLL